MRRITPSLLGTVALLGAASCQHAPIALFDRPPDRSGRCVDQLSGVVPGRAGVCAHKSPAIAASAQSVCIITASTSIRCWTRGVETTVTHPEDRAWREVATASEVAPTMRPTRTCAIDVEGKLYCWGEGANGELGLGATRVQGTPGLVGGDETWRSIALGEQSSCGVTEGGALFCWGRDIHGAPGLDDVPTRVDDRSDWELVAGTRTHFCALSQTGEVRCLGTYSRGPEGEIDEHFELEEPYALPPILHLSAGGRSVCAIDVDGGVWCWGESRLLGIGSITHDASAPVRVALPPIAYLAVGGSTTCAIPTTGQALICWGSGDVERPVPEVLSTDRTARFVAGNQLAMCALEGDRIGCFGAWQRLPEGGATGIYEATQPL